MNITPSKAAGSPLRRLLIGLASSACALSAVPAGAAPSIAHAASSLRDFNGWEVVCDNVRRCVAEGADNDNPGLVVWLWRDAGANGAVKLQIAADKPLHADQMRIDDHPFRLDPATSTTWQDKAAQTYPHRIATTDATAVSTWVTAARDAHEMAIGDQRVSLAGLSAALLAIDDAQGRVGTDTAWRRTGPAPASSVPAPQPLPVVTAARPGPALSPAEQRRLIDSTFARVHAAVARCDADSGAPDGGKGPHDGSAAFALSAGEALVSLTCGDSAAYNASSLWYRIPRTTPFSAKPLVLPVDTHAAGDDAPPPNQLTGASYDPEKATLASFDRARGIGDCGDAMKWVFDGTHFVLAEDRVQGACVGLFMDDWPWLHRTLAR